MKNQSHKDYLQICCELAKESLDSVNSKLIDYPSLVAGRYRLTQFFITLASYFLVSKYGINDDNLYTLQQNAKDYLFSPIPEDIVQAAQWTILSLEYHDNYISLDRMYCYKLLNTCFSLSHYCWDNYYSRDDYCNEMIHDSTANAISTLYDYVVGNL